MDRTAERATMSMRAALYLPGLRPGSMSWTIYQDLAAAIRAHGLGFEVWTDRPDQPVEPSEYTRYLEVRRAPLGLDRVLAPLTRSPRLLQTAFTVARHLRGPNAPDVVYVEIAYPHGVGVDLARRLARSSTALVLKPTGEDVLTIPEAEYGFPRHRLPRRLLHATLARAAGVRCISPLVVEAVRPWTTAPCPVIPSGVSADTVAAARRGPERLRQHRADCRERLIEKLGLEDRPLIVALGRLHPFKGLDLAIDALGQLPDAQLLLVGPSLQLKRYGDYGDWLRRHANARGVGERVRLTGAIPHSQVLDVLGGADAVIVPSLMESMNKVTIEAIAAGAPVIVTRTTGISTFFDAPGIGQIIEPRSPVALADAVRSVIDGQWLPDHDAGRRFVERFAPEVVAGELAALLREAVSR